MKVFYDKDGDLGLVQQRRVAIIGYGSQGHAHALNLRDSGVEVVVGLRPNSASRQKAATARLTVADIPTAVQQADIVMLLLPDEDIARVYEQDVAPHIRSGATLRGRRWCAAPDCHSCRPLRSGP